MPKGDLTTYDQMERTMLRAIPAFEELELDGWLLRSAQGYTGRSNAVYISRSPEGKGAIDTKIDRCENWYHQQNIRPRFRLNTIKLFPAVRQILLDRGYSETHTIHIQTKQISPHNAQVDNQTTVRFPTVEDWVKDFQTLHGLDVEDFPRLKKMLTIHAGTNCLLRMELDGQPVAVGRGVLDGLYFGLFNFFVDEAFRRRGIASEMIDILEKWAVERGATLSYLQVDSNNPSAMKLYHKLGYRTIYEYWYLM